MGKVALVAGASGLVGGYLVKYLTSSDQYSRVILLNRKSLGIMSEKVEEVLVDFEKLEAYQQYVGKSDVAFCCLGTTMKKSGSKEAFYRVDYEYVIRFARLAYGNNETFVLVSAIGANKDSLFFYNRVKGEIENTLKNMNFPSLLIVRPSLLLGKRKKLRFGEKLGEIFLSLIRPFLVGRFKKYRAIHASKVARSMAENIHFEGVKVIESSDI